MNNARPTLANVIAYFLVLGMTGFGGPVALANCMRTDLVDSRKWITSDEYEEGLTIATACPGPLAYQLGVYCGHITHGVAGGLGVAVAFALAPFALVTLAAYLYVHFSANWEIRALFYGVGPVVVALIFKSCWTLGRKTLRVEPLAWAFAAIACLVTVVVQKELIGLFLTAGLLGVFVFTKKTAVARSPELERRDPTEPIPAKDRSTLLSAASAALPIASSKLFLFFFKTGLLVFGSGLVIVPFLKTYVVDQYHWLDNRAFLDSVAIGMISPGPVVITATFVGYLLNDFSGAVAATVGMFLPSVLFTIIGTPILRRYRSNARVQGFVRGVSVAVVGVLVGTGFLIVRTAIGDLFSGLLFAIALVTILALKRVPDQAVVFVAAAVGLVAYPLIRPEWMLR